MDLKLTKETIAVKEAVLDNCFEQAIETDYILPDYYPDIFRVIKCRIIPRIVSQSINYGTGKEDKKLCYEAEALIRVWYLSENSKVINCIEQTLRYSKSIDLNLWTETPEVIITSKCDYANCRVVNQRRLDIRGAISTKVKVFDEKSQSIISDACGCNIQLKKNSITFPSKRRIVSKKITVIEELELGVAKPPIISVIKSDCRIISKEQKAINNKVIVKGEAEISMLYTCSKEDEHGIEAMKFTVPYSQIIDIDGIDEGFDINVDTTQCGCDIITKGSNENTSFECELVLLVNVCASKLETCDIIEDAYSTSYECELIKSDIKLENVVKTFKDNTSCKSTLRLNDGEICSVLDSSCEISNVATHLSQESGSYVINGNIGFSGLVETKDGFPVVIEGDSIFEYSIDCSDNIDCTVIEPKITIVNSSYTMTSDNSIEIIADILVEGVIIQKISKKTITGITMNTDTKKTVNKNCALKLYYTDKNEDIWEIAKRNSTSVSAILEENEMTTDILTEKGMLLIPIIN